MTIGLTIIANQLQPYGEHLFIIICKKFLGKDKSLDIIIYKNLQAHKKRNVMTALMLTMSVTFIIFSGSGIAGQMKGVVEQVKSMFGTDLYIFSAINNRLALDEYHINQFLHDYNSTNPNVLTSWSWATYEFYQHRYIYDIQLMPLSMFPKRKAQIIGVSDNIMQTIYHKYYLPSEYASYIDNYTTFDDYHSKYDGVSNIFEPVLEEEEDYDPHKVICNNNFYPVKKIKKKIRRVVIPVGLQDASGLGVNTPAILELNSLKHIAERVNITHTARKISGFNFSRYGTLSFLKHDILMSFQNYKEILDRVRADVMDLNDPEAQHRFLDYETPIVLNSTYA